MVRLPIMTLFLSGQASSPITSAPSQIAAGQITKALKMWNPEIQKCFLEFSGHGQAPAVVTGISGVQVQKNRFQELLSMKFTCFNSVTRLYCHEANESAKKSSQYSSQSFALFRIQLFQLWRRSNHSWWRCSDPSSAAVGCRRCSEEFSG